MNTQDKMRLVEDAVKTFKGNAHELERAIGAFFLGHHVGWKVVYLIHDKRTIRKYEEVLGVEFRAELPERGPYAYKSLALALADEIGNFWKSVKGEIAGVRTSEMN